MGNGGIFGRSSLGALGTLTDVNCDDGKADGAADAKAGLAADPFRHWHLLPFDQNRRAYNACYQAAWIEANRPGGGSSGGGGEVVVGGGGGYGGGGGTTVLPEQQIVGGGGGNFSGQPCNSEAVRKHVQAAINTDADGKWGPASQTALQKAGGTFQSYAPGCTGNPPSYGAITGGGGGGTVATTYTAPPATTSTSSMSGLLSKPIVWVGLAMAAVGGYVLLTGKKKGGKVRRNGRKRRMKLVQISTPASRKRAKARKGK